MLSTYRRHVSKPMFAIFLALLLALMPAAGFSAMAEETYNSWTEYKEAKGMGWLKTQYSQPFFVR